MAPMTVPTASGEKDADVDYRLNLTQGRRQAARSASGRAIWLCTWSRGSPSRLVPCSQDVTISQRAASWVWRSVNLLISMITKTFSCYGI